MYLSVGGISFLFSDLFDKANHMSVQTLKKDVEFWLSTKPLPGLIIIDLRDLIHWSGSSPMHGCIQRYSTVYHKLDIIVTLLWLNIRKYCDARNFLFTVLCGLTPTKQIASRDVKCFSADASALFLFQKGND